MELMNCGKCGKQSILNGWKINIDKIGNVFVASIV